MGANSSRKFALDAPQSPRAKIVELQTTKVCLRADLGVQVWFLDEIHSVLAAPRREQRVVFNTLRYLRDEPKLSLVCLGLWKRQAINAEWLLREFQRPYVVPSPFGGEYAIS